MANKLRVTVGGAKGRGLGLDACQPHKLWQVSHRQAVRQRFHTKVAVVGQKDNTAQCHAWRE